MRVLITIALFCLLGHADAQVYTALTVPDSLSKGVDWVQRSEETVVTIKSPSKYTLKYRVVRTLLNADASDKATYVTSYDKFTSIRSLEGTAYDMFGKSIKNTKKNDWEDRSAPDGFSLITDQRYKVAELHHTSYPYTVVFEDEEEDDGTLALPSWSPIKGTRMSVESSRYVLIAPAGYKVRYKAFQNTPEPVIEKKGDQVVYTWEIKGLKPVHREVMSPSWREQVPGVVLAPSQFEAEGYKGDMSTWESYGKFMYQLIKDRDALPTETRVKVHELTDNLRTDREKVNVLYEYMQKNTHYISVQLGIGGWQPFDATYVATKKYGDCKALSNFMIALLKEAGITAKYVEIRAGSDPPTFLEDFPSLQSNHVICCVPLAKDTIWLECTSQTVSPGFMGTFTGNRKAIMIEPTGATIVHTPVYGPNDNQVLRRIDASIDGSGTLEAKVHTLYRGVEQEYTHGLLRELSADERTKYLNEIFDLPTYQVLDSRYQEIRKPIPEMEETLALKSEGFAVQTGKRLFVKPVLLRRSKEGLPADSSRKNDLLIRESKTERDTICIRIPAGYHLEAAPKEQKLEQVIGSYSLSYAMEGDKLCCYRETVVRAGRYPAKDYMAIKDFDERKRSLDRSRFVFVKNE